MSFAGVAGQAGAERPLTVVPPLMITGAIYIIVSGTDTNDRTASSLTVLETAIDQITRSERWVGTTAEREALAKTVTP